MVSIFDHSPVRPWIAAAVLLAIHSAYLPAAPPTTPANTAASIADSKSNANTKSTKSPANDFPTYARVQYVVDCMARSGGSEADLYKCSCTIDRIAARLNYDQFVEASTYSHYSSLGGENAGIFRDHPLAQQQAKLMRSIENAARHSCGLKPTTP